MVRTEREQEHRNLRAEYGNDTPYGGWTARMTALKAGLSTLCATPALDKCPEATLELIEIMQISIDSGGYAHGACEIAMGLAENRDALLACPEATLKLSRQTRLGTENCIVTLASQDEVLGACPEATLNLLKTLGDNYRFNLDTKEKKGQISASLAEGKKTLEACPKQLHF